MPHGKCQSALETQEHRLERLVGVVEGKRYPGALGATVRGILKERPASIRLDLRPIPLGLAGEKQRARIRRAHSARPSERTRTRSDCGALSIGMA